MTTTTTEQTTPVQHIGFILDGNRRWAKERDLAVAEGHRQGYQTLKNVLDACLERKIPYLSGYVFSTENWRRTPREVKFLLGLVMNIVTRDLEEIHQKGVRIVWMGSELEVSPKIRKAFRHAEEYTKHNTKATLAICFNHGGKRELSEAVQRIVLSGMPASDITEQTISDNVDYPEVPPIDLLIRTGGERRLSGFMLWRAEYSELIFRDEYWPDFSPEILDECLLEYTNRQRRFGG